MKIIVCIDDNGGMLFNHRRQSQDSKVRADMMLLSESEELWMNSYSAGQFELACQNLVIDDNFLENAPENVYCFIENSDISPYINNVSQMVAYRWNRSYPADAWLPLAQLTEKMKMVSSTDFAGTSHDRITREVYSL